MLTLIFPPSAGPSALITLPIGNDCTEVSEDDSHFLFLTAILVDFRAVGSTGVNELSAAGKI